MEYLIIWMVLVALFFYAAMAIVRMPVDDDNKFIKRRERRKPVDHLTIVGLNESIREIEGKQ